MANKITIKFEAQGARELKGAIDQLYLAQVKLEKGEKAHARATKKLNLEYKKLGKATGVQVNHNRLLTNSFATMRSTLLLASFGFTLIAGSIGKALKMYGEQEKAILKLNNALGFNSELLQKQASEWQNLTGIGDEVIINAQSILASFVRNEEAVSNLTKSTLDLSTALGIDLNSAANLLGKTIGSATNSLSRYGIAVTGTVNSSERIESITKSVNLLFGDMAEVAGSKTAGALAKLGSSLGDFIENLGELLVRLGVINVIDLLTASFKGLGLAIDGALRFIGLSNENLKDAITLSDEIVKNHNKELQSIKSLNDIEAVRAVIAAKKAEIDEQVALGLRKVIKEQDKTAKSAENLNNSSEDLLLGKGDFAKSMEDYKNNMVDVAGVTQLASDRFQENTDTLDENSKALVKTGEATKLLALTDKELMMALAKEQEMMAAGIQQLAAREIAVIKLNKAQQDSNRELANQLPQESALAEIQIKRALTVKQLEESLINIIEYMAILNTLKAEELDLERAMEDLILSRKLQSANLIVDSMEMVTGALQSNLDRRISMELDSLKKSEKYKRASNDKQEQMEDDVIKQYESRRKALFFADKALAISEIYIQTELAAIKAWGQLGIFGLPMEQIIRAKGIVAAGVALAQPFPEYEYGGLIGGQRHAQGGTMINAERGEFVMRRDAVESIGVDNLDAMNQGGGGSSIVINNPIISSEFVETELPELIAEAVRKGADFGMS